MAQYSVRRERRGQKRSLTGEMKEGGKRKSCASRDDNRGTVGRRVISSRRSGLFWGNDWASHAAGKQIYGTQNGGVRVFLSGEIRQGGESERGIFVAKRR